MTDPNLYHQPAAGTGHETEHEEEPAAGGLCGLLMKKVGGGHDQKPPSDVPMADIEHQEVNHGGNPTTLADQLHRPDGDDGGSSSSSEEGEGGEKKRKKTRGMKMKDRIKKKLSADKEEDHQAEIVITGENDGEANQATLIEMHEEDSEEKKGFLEKFMDKLPLYGQEMKKPDEEHHVDVEKGILDKIKDKIPGSNRSNNGDHLEAKKED